MSKELIKLVAGGVSLLVGLRSQFKRAGERVINEHITLHQETFKKGTTYQSLHDRWSAEKMNAYEFAVAVQNAQASVLWRELTGLYPRRIPFITEALKQAFPNATSWN